MSESDISDKLLIHNYLNEKQQHQLHGQLSQKVDNAFEKVDVTDSHKRKQSKSKVSTNYNDNVPNNTGMLGKNLTNQINNTLLTLIPALKKSKHYTTLTVITQALTSTDCNAQQTRFCRF